jgi:hypothetical protein
LRPHRRAIPSTMFGLDHRGGHLWPLSMMAVSSRAPFLGCYGAFAWHRGRWDGRRHHRGLILKLNYTAREGGSSLQRAAKNAMKAAIADAEKVPLARLFSTRHEFPTEWHQFRHSTLPTATLNLALSPDLFPFQFRVRSLRFKKWNSSFPSRKGKNWEVVRHTPRSMRLLP